MYTATLLGSSVDKQTRRRMVTVRFTEGESTFDKDFGFQIDTPIEVIKKTVKSYLDEINFVPPELDGDWTVNEPTPEVPTQAELNRIAWESDFAKLKKVQELIDCGALVGDEAAIVTLRNKVKADFKPAYLG